MSKLKEPIDLSKLQTLSASLGELRSAIDKTIADCQAIEMESTMIEGWPTLARGLQFMLDQAQKFVGSASKIHTLSGEDILMPGQSYAPTKKPYTPRAQRVEESLEGVRLGIAAEPEVPIYDISQGNPTPKQAEKIIKAIEKNTSPKPKKPKDTPK